MKNALIGFAMMALLAACASKDPVATTKVEPMNAQGVNG